MTCLSKAFASQSRRDGPALQPLWAQMMSAWPGPASGQGGRGQGDRGLESGDCREAWLQAAENAT